MRREFVCPRCGLVLEASAVEGVVWMGEHVAQCDVPARVHTSRHLHPNPTGACAVMPESICPHCGLVIAAAPDRAAVWLAEHVAKFHFRAEIERHLMPERAMFTAVDMQDYARLVAQLSEHPPSLSVNPPLAFTWAETLSVDDAEWLHDLGIDPT